MLLQTHCDCVQEEGCQAKAKTSNGTVRTGCPAPCTSRRIFSVVSRENVASPHRSHTCAGIRSTSTRFSSTVNTSLTKSDLAVVFPQTWHLNMATSGSGIQATHSSLAHTW